MKICQQVAPQPPPENYADRFSSYYVDNGADGAELSLTGRRSVVTSRAHSVAACERALDDDDAELIASYLDARDAATYEQAKQDIYTQTYRRQLEDERRRLYEQRQRDYDDHVRRHSGRRLPVDEQALDAAIKRQLRASSAVTRPPRPPSGARRMTSEAACSQRRVLCDGADGGGLRVVAGDTEGAIRNMHRAALQTALAEQTDAKPVKRVAFRSRPTSASGAYSTQRSARNGGHYFVWRDATDVMPDSDDLWKMRKYANVKSKIDNKWTRDPFLYKTRDDGKVDLKLECPQGEEVSVNLRVEAQPSRSTAYYY